jgi:putative ABC transport system substrate-binding protein
VKRRSFITLLGGAAVTAWPLAAHGQQGERVRRIGVLWAIADNPRYRLYMEAFLQRLQQLGWIEGRNLRIEYRYGDGDADRIRRSAAELVALAPDVILATGSSTLAALLQATRTVPIVFSTVPDPVGSGFVDSLARPGGNATGFEIFEFDISGKRLEMLKEIAPRVSRVAFLREAGIPAATGQFAALQTAGRLVGVEVSSINVVSDARSLERAVGTFALAPNGGLAVQGSSVVAAQRELIITLAAGHKLPAIYDQSHFVAAGGLISYGVKLEDFYPRAAEYVDRILRGEKPADLPIQAPTKNYIVINLKTARALGLTIPDKLLALADEVIE